MFPGINKVFVCTSSWFKGGAEVFRTNFYSKTMLLGRVERLTFYTLGFSENFRHESRRACRYEFVDMWNARIGVRMRKL